MMKNKTFELTSGEIAVFAACYATALQSARNHGGPMVLYESDSQMRISCLEQALGEAIMLREIRTTVIDCFGEDSEMFQAFKQIIGG